MEVRLQKLGKRYSRHWIFRNLQFTVTSGEKVAITGPNGSGKSTLIQIIMGAQPTTEGSVHYLLNNNEIDSADVFKHLTFAAPYTQMVEELNLQELFHFQSKFKSIPIVFDEFLGKLSYSFKRDQPIKFFSSGMKQRVKLAFAVLSESKCVLLDEPTSNLDRAGKDWYQSLMAENIGNRSLIIASNEPEEYAMTHREILVG